MFAIIVGCEMCIIDSLYSFTFYSETLNYETFYSETFFSETLYYETFYSETLYSVALYSETLYYETLYSETGKYCLIHMLLNSYPFWQPIPWHAAPAAAALRCCILP